jgi:hypothetical protein
VLSHGIGLLVHLRRVAAALGRCACVLVCVDARDARGCVSTLRLGGQTSSCCGSACASLAAVTHRLQLLRCCCCVASACFCTCMASLSWCCDLHNRRSVADLCCRMTALCGCGLSGCVPGVASFGVTRTWCCA